MIFKWKLYNNYILYIKYLKSIFNINNFPLPTISEGMKNDLDYGK